MAQFLRPTNTFFTSDVVTKRNQVFFQKDDDVGADAGGGGGGNGVADTGTDVDKQAEAVKPEEADYISGYSKGRYRIGVVVKVPGDDESSDEDYYSSSYSSTSSPNTSQRSWVTDEEGDGSGDKDEEVEESKGGRGRQVTTTSTATPSSRPHSVDENYAEVSWFGHTIAGTALEHQNNLALVDRPIYFGEIVTSAKDSTGCTGVVTGARMTVDLLTLEDKIIRNIDTRNIGHVRTHRPGLWVLSMVGNPWLGRVDDVQEDIVVEFRDGSRCRIKHNKFHKIETYTDAYWTEDTRSDFEGRDCRYYPGQRVKVKDKKVLESATWIAGAASDHRRGVICKVEVCTLQIRWLMPIPTCNYTEFANVPPPIDISPNDVVSLGFDEFCNTDWCVGDWCLFSKKGGDSNEEGNSVDEKTSKLMVVLCSHTVCDVRWQDGRLTKNIPGKELIALKHCDDSDFWPNDFVVMRQEVGLQSDQGEATSARKSGVIQTVNHEARTAVVKWQVRSEDADVFLLGKEETVSLYALDSHPDFGHYGIGSMVILLDVDRAKERQKTSSSGWTNQSQPSTASIFGQIRALDNGRLHIVWADGSMSFEYPARVFCVDKDDLESMVSEFDSYSYSESYDGSYHSSSWETIAEDENDVGNEAEVDAVLDQVDSQRKAMIAEHALAKLQKLHKLEVKVEDKDKPKSDGNSNGEWSGGDESNQAKDKKVLRKLFAMFGFKMSEGVERTSSYYESSSSKSPGLKDIINDNNSENRDADERVSTDALAGLESPSTQSNETLLKKEDFKTLLKCLASKHSKFEIIPQSVDDHFFKSRCLSSNSAKFPKVILKQWNILKKGLPDGIWVKCYEDRMDLMRAIIVGSPGTPYHYALFSFDIYFPPDFPHVPPELHYRSHGYRLNPNLYQNGRICLSLLNTWNGRQTEKWDPKCSSILQVLVSIQGLVLVQKPYFNEAGFEKQVGTVSGEKNAILYNESAHLLCLKLVISTIQKPPESCEALVRDHFRMFASLIQISMEDYINGKTIGFSEYSKVFQDEKEKSIVEPSDGFKIMLSQIKPRILSILNSV